MVGDVVTRTTMNRHNIVCVNLWPGPLIPVVKLSLSPSLKNSFSSVPNRKLRGRSAAESRNGKKKTRVQSYILSNI